ncbi:hypothetical protein SY83_19115 [Paenibacillus swuensis]|uniref:Copper amine oxidase-like N-terminal domain-containing protein n=1 Tax=Paenibacillus swuensis TaxID=1178515 RepID=A0A172TMQ5_9BACL|nr:copper amine oxidase N-terminal domain-containing protein [Paenibacillus swuensis]ANE48053.1 hypothetical protein SY83_19115 [Paenibacillus swuensis]
MKLGSKKLYITFVLIILVLMTACQAIGGIDLNKALLDNSTVTSGEGKQSISWELELDPSAELDAAQQEQLNRFKSGSIVLDHYKVQDQATASVKGAVTLAGKSIPFELYTDKEQLSLKVDGSRKLLTMPLGESGELGLGGLEQDKAFRDEVVTTLIRNLPNPKNTSFQLGHKAVIQGEEVELTRISTEIKGTDLHEVLFETAGNLLNDEANIQQLLEKMLISAEEEALSAEEAAEEAASMMQEFHSFMTEFKADLENDDQLVYKMLNNRNNLFKLQLGIDSSLRIREAKAELYYRIPKIPGEVNLPVRAVRMIMSSEMSQQNMPVTADVPSDAQPTMDLDSLDKPRTFIASLDTKSALYDVLKNDLNLMDRKSEFYITDTDLSRPSHTYNAFGQPYVKMNSAQIGARNLASQMDYTMVWDATRHKLTIKDNGRYIQLKLGSKTATANGKAIVLPYPPHVINNLIYIPVKPVTQALNTDLYLENNQEYGTVIQLSITE